MKASHLVFRTSICPGLGRSEDIEHQTDFKTTALDNEVNLMTEVLKDKKVCLLLPIFPINVLFEPFACPDFATKTS